MLIQKSNFLNLYHSKHDTPTARNGNSTKKRKSVKVTLLLFSNMFSGFCPQTPQVFKTTAFLPHQPSELTFNR